MTDPPTHLIDIHGLHDGTHVGRHGDDFPAVQAQLPERLTALVSREQPGASNQWEQAGAKGVSFGVSMISSPLSATSRKGTRPPAIMGAFLGRFRAYS